MTTSELKCLYEYPFEVGEGPHWSADEKTLYWVDMLGFSINAFHQERKSYYSWPMPCAIAAVFCTDNLHFLRVVLSDGIALFNKKTGALKYEFKPILKDGEIFNDAKQDAQGRIWAVSKCAQHRHAVGGLYVIDGNDCRELDDQFIIGNGLGFSSDHRYFYTADSLAKTIYRYELNFDAGTVSSRQRFIDLTGAVGVPDGLCVDANDNIWSASWGGGVVRCFDTNAKQIETIRLPVSQVTCCCLGGADMKTLFITTAAYTFSDEDRRKEPLAGSVFYCDV
jgi:sugar lactone lactonase YvrE